MNTSPTPSVVADEELVERVAFVIEQELYRLLGIQDFSARIVARAALAASDRDVLVGAFAAQTLLVDRLCSAVDQASEDIGHESIDALLELIGPQNELCIEALGGRAALGPLGVG